MEKWHGDIVRWKMDEKEMVLRNVSTGMNERNLRRKKGERVTHHFISEQYARQKRRRDEREGRPALCEYRECYMLSRIKSKSKPTSRSVFAVKVKVGP